MKLSMLEVAILREALREFIRYGRLTFGTADLSVIRAQALMERSTEYLDQWE